jgi:endogenous inhibitor of DNA gyrase (YacG/DUF329 family)
MRDRKGQKNPNYKGGFEAKCAACGKPVYVKPYEKDRLHHYCSKPCQYRGSSERTTGEQHWRWQGGPVELRCQYCNEVFFQRRAEYNRRPAKYCSHRCKGLGRVTQVVLECAVCSAPFLAPSYKTDAKFCSRECKRLLQRKQRTARDISKRRLRVAISTGMGRSLRGRKAGRSWEKLVGYTVVELMRHLEALFQEGMTWENFGDWHIDHKRPVSSFSFADVTDPDFQECWALENLQPLWELENLSKGSKWDASG